MFFLLSDDLSDIQPTSENLDEITEALTDLDDDPNMGSFGSGPYWPKIRERLLRSSNSQDAKEAVKEWKYIRMWIDWGKCELCDHQPIKFHFQIENRVNGNRMVLGSECIYNYLVIPGVPSKEVLKKRLNQLRSVAKREAEGTLESGSVQEMEKLQELERDVNILIAKVARPERDIDIGEFEAHLADPLYRIQILGGNSQGVQTVKDIGSSCRRLLGFLRNTVQKRSTKYSGTLLLPAVEAIMRFRDLGDKKTNLLALQKHITDTFKLGASEEVIEMAWAEVRGLKKDAVANYVSLVDAAKNREQARYTIQLEQLKPYPHLAFIVQAGVNLVKDGMDKTAAKVLAALETIDGEKAIDRTVLSPWSLKGPDAHSLSWYTSSVAQEASRTLEIAQAAINRPHTYVPDLQAYFGVPTIRDNAGVTKAILDAAEHGELDLDVAVYRQLTTNKKLLARFAEEIDEVKAHLASTEGRKVFDVMSEQLKFDAKKFYSKIDMSNGWLVSFGQSIFQQWKRGLQGLSYKQRAVVDKQVASKAAPQDSLWDHMQSDLNQRWESPSKFASDDGSVWQYGR